MRLLLSFLLFVSSAAHAGECKVALSFDQGLTSRHSLHGRSMGASAKKYLLTSDNYQGQTIINLYPVPIDIKNFPTAAEIGLVGVSYVNYPQGQFSLETPNKTHLLQKFATHLKGGHEQMINFPPREFMLLDFRDETTFQGAIRILSEQAITPLFAQGAFEGNPQNRSIALGFADFLKYQEATQRPVEAMNARTDLIQVSRAEIESKADHIVHSASLGNPQNRVTYYFKDTHGYREFVIDSLGNRDRIVTPQRELIGYAKNGKYFMVKKRPKPNDRSVNFASHLEMVKSRLENMKKKVNVDLSKLSESELLFIDLSAFMEKVFPIIKAMREKDPTKFNFYTTRGAWLQQRMESPDVKPEEIMQLMEMNISNYRSLMRVDPSLKAENIEIVVPGAKTIYSSFLHNEDQKTFRYIRVGDSNQYFVTPLTHSTALFVLANFHRITALDQIPDDQQLTTLIAQSAMMALPYVKGGTFRRSGNRYEISQARISLLGAGNSLVERFITNGEAEIANGQLATLPQSQINPGFLEALK